MNSKEALRILSQYSPCPHENADTNLGTGEIWAKCEDCEETFLQEHWQRYKDDAKKFDEAVDRLREALKSNEAPNQSAKLSEQYGGHWSDHPDFPVRDWRFEVANGDTKLGYWDWCVSMIEAKNENA
jgi:hypothetical protein